MKFLTEDKNLKKAFILFSETYENAKTLNYTIVPEQADVKCYAIKKDGNTITVNYSRICDLFLAIGNICAGDFSARNDRKFESVGIMLDCARNAVPSLPALKRYIINASVLGYTYIGLYFEDCFEVIDEPFFGYNRGRYTLSQQKEIVEFAQLFGIEIRPYIQTLAHLSNIFHHWEQYYDKCRDFGDILLMDNERTYLLIENMIKTVAKIYKTDKIHIGMDEAYMMALGEYRIKHGIVDRTDAFMRHVNKVVDICNKYNLSPIAWSDMFIAHADKNRNPKNLTLNLWEYCGQKESDYLKLYEDVKKISDNVCFAGAAHKWYGYAPLNEYTLTTVIPAIKAFDGKLKDVAITIWGDDGSECSYNAMTYSVMNFASLCLTSPLKEKISEKKALFMTNYTLKEFMLLDLPNKVFDAPMDIRVNPSKYLLFEDVLMGIGDRNESEVYIDYFKKHAKTLKNLAKRKSFYSYLFEEMYRLTEILIYKGTLRKELLSAYKKKDYDTLKTLANDRIKVCVKKIKAFMVSLEKQWLTDNKPQGFEVQNIRFGGLIERLEFCSRYINRFLNGEMFEIEELETDLSPKVEKNKYNGAMLYNSYEQNVSYGNISHRVYN